MKKYGEIDDVELLNRIKYVRLMSESVKYADLFAESLARMIKMEMISTIQKENEKLNELLAQKVKEIASKNDIGTDDIKLQFNEEKGTIEVVQKEVEKDITKEQ